MKTYIDNCGIAAAKSIPEVVALRLALIKCGYRPIPLYDNKDPCLKEWPQVVADEALVRSDSWWKQHPDTGVITKETPVIDVDIKDITASEQLAALIRKRFADKGKVLHRVGRPPKFAVPFKTDEPFKKKFLLVWPPGVSRPEKSKDCQKIEILGDGQHFVVDGIHPKAKRHYDWNGVELWTVAREELPELTGAEADAFLIEAKALLISLGWGVWENKNKNTKKSAIDSENKWTKLNSAALANLEAWVPELFPEAEPCRGGYRVKSATLGRDLEEDLSLMPEGIKDFGIHDMGDEKEGKRTPIDIVVEYGKKKFIDAVIWLRQRLHLTEGVSLEDFCAYMPASNYIFTPSRAPWPASSVNARLGEIPLFRPDGSPQRDKNGDPVAIPASLWLARNCPVEEATWAPGMPMIIQNRLIADSGWIERNGVSCFNLYRPPTIVHGDAKKAGPWIDHVYKVFNKQDANHIITWCAHRVQKPQEKINHVLGMGSNDQGVGKDTILAPVRYAIGPWNFSEISPQKLLARFNGYLKSVILRVSEVRDLGDMTRHQFYEHMKAYSASPPETLECDEKNLKEHRVMNCTGIIVSTNHKTDGIYLPPEDRRHYIAWSERVQADFENDYWKKIYNWYDNEGGNSHAAAYLAQFDISSFDPKAPPPKTDAFWEIVNANRSSEDGELADAIDELKRKGRGDAFTLADIESVASEDIYNMIRDRRTRRAIPHKISKCGYVPVRNTGAESDGLWVIGKKRQVVYARKELSLSEQLKAVQAVIDKGPPPP